MSHYQKFVKDMGVVGVAQILSSTTGLILLPLLTKSFGAKAYGIWAQIIVTIAFLSPVVLLGITNSIIRFLPGLTDSHKIREHIWSSAAFISAFAGIIALLLIFFGKPLSIFLKIPPQFVVALGILLVVDPLMRLFLSFFQAFQQAEKFAFFTALIPMGELGLVALNIRFQYGLQGAVNSLIFIRTGALITMALLTIRKVGISFPHFSNMRRYLQYSLPTLVSAFAFQGINLNTQYFIAAFLGILFVGYYAPAYSIASLLALAYLPLTTILPPLLAQFFEQQKTEEVKQFLAYSLKYMLFLLIPSVVGLSTVSLRVLEIFSTKDIASHSYLLLPVALFNVLLYAVYTQLVQILSLFLKTNLAGLIWIGALIADIVFNIFLIPLFGILGAGLATLFSYGVVLGATSYVSSRYLVFPVDWKALAKSVLSSFLLAAFLFFIRPVGIIPTVGAFLGGLLVYIFSMLILKGFGKKDLAFIKTILPK